MTTASEASGGAFRGAFDGVELLLKLHQEGGLSVATTRADDAQCVARSTLFPDGDLTTRLHPTVTDADAARHLTAVRAQSQAIGRARKALVAWVGVAGAAGVLAVTGWGTEATWLTWIGGSGVAAQGIASVRFLWRTRSQAP